MICKEKTLRIGCFLPRRHERVCIAPELNMLLRGIRFEIQKAKERLHRSDRTVGGNPYQPL